MSRRFLCLLFLLIPTSLFAEPGFSGIEQETAAPTEEATYPRACLDYSASIPAGEITSAYMQWQESGLEEDRRQWEELARRYGEELESHEMDDFKSYCQTAAPNTLDALKPTYETLRNRPGFEHSLVELSDLWARPVYDRHFPGYGDRRIWLSYKRGRELGREIGSEKIEEQTHRYQETTTENVVVLKTDWQTFQTRFPNAPRLEATKARTPNGVKDAYKSRITLNPNQSIQLMRVSQVEFVWYRLIAAPVSVTPGLPRVFVKAGEYYIPHDMPHSELYLVF